MSLAVAAAALAAAGGTPERAMSVADASSAPAAAGGSRKRLAVGTPTAAGG